MEYPCGNRRHVHIDLRSTNSSGAMSSYEYVKLNCDLRYVVYPKMAEADDVFWVRDAFLVTISYFVIT